MMNVLMIVFCIGIALAAMWILRQTSNTAKTLKFKLLRWSLAFEGVAAMLMVAFLWVRHNPVFWPGVLLAFAVLCVHINVIIFHKRRFGVL